MSEYVLELKGITKIFPGVKALNNVQFQLKPGEVHALMGENGAGKSTFIKVITGVHKAEEGEMFLNGQKVDFKGPKDAQAAGIAAVYQHPTSYPHLTVAENIFMGHEIIKNRMIQWKAMNTEANKLLKQLDADFDATAEMGTLSVAQQQMVEIAKAVSVNAKVIVFDEPTSSLTEQEVEHLFDIIEMLKKRGCGIIYISHKMAEIKRISDEITIMRDGTWVATEKADDLEMDDIIRLMVGRELTNQFPPKTNKPGDVALEVEHLSGMYSILNDVSFKARKGEILGIAGLDGSGRTETLETIFGIATRKSGTIKLDGKQVSNKNAQDSIKNGFALLTEERRATGIFGILNIRENTVISSLKRHKKGFYLSEKSMKEDTQKYIDALRTKTPSQETKIRALSGGNQQKVILGRWLLTDPEVLLLDEPTRGIDVGAKYEIYQLIIDLANRGKVVIVVSSEMPELLGICDRIMVMSGGRLAGEIDAEEATQELIMTYAAKYV